MGQRKRRRPRFEPRAHRSPPGTPPGTPIRDPKAPRPKITVIGYGPDAVVEEEVLGPGELAKYLEHHPLVWVNVDGLGDLDVIRGIGEVFGLHDLALEDVVHAHQRPKVEVYGEHCFVVLRMLSSGTEHFESEQLSLFLGTSFVLTFQEHAGDGLNPVRARLHKSGRSMHGRGPDYLAYAIMDAVIDEYFPFLERVGELMEEIEDEVIVRPVARTVHRIHELKRSLLRVRRAMWPMRDAIATLIRDPIPGISDTTRVYLRDCADHAHRIIDLVETYRELGADLTGLYLSTVSNRMNDVMKVLTVIATIFIPLTFIAGVYGMNFDPGASRWNMPELAWAFGYPAAILLMLAVALGMLFFFKRRGWLGSWSGHEGPEGDEKQDRPRNS